MPLLSTRAAGSARGFGFQGGGELFMIGTGGTVTQDGSFQIHTFTSGGTFEVTQLATDPANDVIEYLLSAGGAGCGNGGTPDMWGGGGAGGCKTESSQPVAQQTYPVTVGTGGGQGGAGGASSFYGQTGNGGGQGGGQNQGGQSGGSGGGGGQGA